MVLSKSSAKKFWRDGTWQLLEDTSKGFLLFVQSKSKEESAA